MWCHPARRDEVVDMLCPDCGTKSVGILISVPFKALSPFENHHRGPYRRVGRPPLLEGNVYVGKCKGCGGPIYRPEKRRGRPPKTCDDCRHPHDLRS